jgi:hypothetical protein
VERSEPLELSDLKASEKDIATVTEQLGRSPRGAFRVIVRDADGLPAVIMNAPFLDDGTPMPTLYWLTGADLIKRIGHLESTGGVDQAEAEVDPDDLQVAHDRYAAERSALIPEGHPGPLPTNGVAGTRKGVKCLHAHYAYYLAGGDDPVGKWVGRQLRKQSGHP